jgi:hypothetical protein
MSEITDTPIEPPRKLRFDWVIPALFRPRQAFSSIMGGMNTAWLTPILLLTAAGLLYVIAKGSIQQATTVAMPGEMPPDYEYYSTDQQANYQQAVSITSGPLLTLILPGVGAILGVWLGWLAVGGLMHLVLTLFGGRGAMGTSLGMVAWANLPFAVRDIERALYVMASNRLIQSPGLSGFASPGIGSAFLSLIDIFVIWNIVLLLVGVTKGHGLSRGKAGASVLITVGVVLAIKTGVGFAGSMAGSIASGGF